MKCLKSFIVFCAMTTISTALYADGSPVAEAASAVASSAVASSSAVAVASEVNPKKARIRLFGQNGTGVVYYPNSKCEGGSNSVTVSGGLGTTFSSFFGTIKSESIGIPETETTRNLAKRSSLLSKAYFREYQINAGEPITVALSFQDVGGAHCNALVYSFVAESGVDYEGRLDMDFDAKTCSYVMNSVGNDGSLLPVRLSSSPSCKH